MRSGTWQRCRSRWPALVAGDRGPLGALPDRRRRRRARGGCRRVLPRPAGRRPVGGDAALLRTRSSPLVQVPLGGRSAWNRATRIEARDFCRWMLVAGKPSRPHWRNPGRRPRRAVTRTRRRCGRTRNGPALLLRFHLEAGSGPVSIRSRWTGRASGRTHPITIRWSRTANERAGLYRPRVPSRIPRSVPDAEFNEIFARLPSHRDRALVAFYVLHRRPRLGIVVGDLGRRRSGRQVITVIRKGTRELRNCRRRGRVRVAAALPGGDGRAVSRRGQRQPLWWTCGAGAAVDLSCGASHVRAGRATAGGSATLHSLRHTAAYRMAEDPASR